MVAAALYILGMTLMQALFGAFLQIRQGELRAEGIQPSTLGFLSVASAILWPLVSLGVIVISLSRHLHKEPIDGA